MKKTFSILLLAGLSFSLGLNAQTESSKTKGQSGSQSTLIGNSAKSSYVANQEYLMPNSNVPSKNVFGDSLKGFDEAGIKSSLLGRGLSGKEIYGHILHLKREFINKKYGLGSSAKLNSVITGATQPNMGGANVGGKPIGGSSNINVAPCVNEDFESTTAGTYTAGNAVSGWSITSRSNNSQCNPTNWTSGSPEFEIIQTPIFNYPGAGTIPNSPLGGTNVARLNDYGNNANNYSMTRITQTFPVTSANTLFQFAYAGYWEDGGGGHYCCPTSYDQPGVNVQMYDCNNNILTCSNLSLSPGSGCQSTGVTYTVTQSASWTNWQVKYIDLTPYIGSCVTIEIITTDCGFGGHYGSTLVDCKCGGQLIGQGLGGAGGSIAGPVSYCSGSGVAQISAPLGYSTYSWVAPPGSPSIAASQATLSTITITNPVPYSVYTVNLVAASGCVFTSTNVIAPSVVNIAGIGSSSTCAGGSSGSGTVVGNGSGAGYNYTWTAASNGSVVGTSSVVSNLPAGLYSVTISGFGAAGCGSASGTIQVATAPPGVINLLKPYCGSEAYLSTLGGTNFQWYNNLTAISATAGGTLPTYTVQNPCNGCLFHLRYTSFQGCNDSIKYTLVSSPPGYMQPTNIPPICVGGTNGTAVIQLAPAAGAPAGMNTFSVWSLGTVTPVYTATLSGAATSFSLSGLSAGGYSVYAFDGSCKYTSNFSVTPYVWSYSLSLPTSSAATCPGGSVAVNVSHQYPPGPGQFTYSWSPTTWLFGSINTTSSTLLFPTTPAGVASTNIYTVIVTPTLVNCPIVKTFTVSTYNPLTPTIVPIPNLCNTSALTTVTAFPAGCTFSTAGTNTPISIAGVINPTAATIGVNTFTAINTTFTCQARQTGTFHVSQFVSSALTSGTINPLCVTSAPYNLNNIVQNSGGTWLKGIPPAGTLITGGSLNPASYNIATNPVTGNYPVTYSINSTPIATVCPSFTTINVTITRTTTPYITQKPEFCTNASPFSMTVTPTGGGWTSAVNGLINNSGLVTPSSASAAIPAAQVTYTVFDGPCLNSATSTLNVSKFIPAGLSGVVPNMCYNSPAFNLISIAQNTTGTWVYDPALNPNYSPTVQAMIQNNMASPIGIPTGTYVLKYKTTSFPNAQLCPDATTITAQVLNPPTPTITPMPAMCNNASQVQLTVTPNTGFWTSTSYLNNTGVFTPSLSQIGNNAVQYLVGTNTCNRQQTQYVNVEAFVSAEILSTVPDQCNNNPALNLTPITVNNLGTWSGPGINGNTFNPANTGSGQFVLTYATASSPSGLCPDQSTVAVSVYSLASPVISQMDHLCSNALPRKLEVTPVGGTFNGASFNVVDDNGVFHPGSAFAGPNVVTYSISSGPCLAFAQTTVYVDKFVSAEMEQPGPYCKNVDPINLNTFAQNQGGEWSGDGVVPGTSMFHPSMASSEYVTVVHTTHSEPTGFCSDTKTISVYVRTPQEAKASVVVVNNCVPVEAVFNSSNSNAQGAKGTWSFGDGSEESSGLANVSHIYSTPGSYVATFNYVDEMGCRSQPVEVNPVTVYELPKPDFTLPDEIFISDPQVQITNLTNVLTNNTYSWRITGVTTDPVADVNPVMEFPKIGKYTITLTATSLNGCKNEVSKTVEVKNNFNIFIPNSFSPNFDGLNDVFVPVFTPYGLDMKSFEMEIFDRWGHSLFRTKDVTKGWDGSIQNKGEPLKEEVYIYRIKYKDLDGNSYNKMGHVSLVK